MVSRTVISVPTSGGEKEGFARGEVFSGSRGLPLPEYLALVMTFPTTKHAQLSVFQHFLQA